MLNAYFFYKVANILHNWKIPFIPFLITTLIFFLYNSRIPHTAKIGKGSRFAYGGIGVIIHNRAVLGKNVIIGSNVTIGRHSQKAGVPKIGDNVYISTGAKIIGPISIGDNCIIGANAVVIRDVPDNKVVAGVPAKIIEDVEEYYKIEKG